MSNRRSTRPFELRKGQPNCIRVIRRADPPRVRDHSRTGFRLSARRRNGRHPATADAKLGNTVTFHRVSLLIPLVHRMSEALQRDCAAHDGIRRAHQRARATRHPWWRIHLACLAGCVFAIVFTSQPVCRTALAGGKLRLSAVDAATGKPVAFRIHLKNPAGKPVKVKGAANWADHATVSKEVTLNLPRGTYTFEVERGPEYRQVTGHFTIEDFADDSKEIPLERIVDMAGEGWFAGDLNVVRAPADLPTVMEAEELRVVSCVTWGNLKAKLPQTPPATAVTETSDGRFAGLLAGCDERLGSSLLFHRASQPWDLPPAKSQWPLVGASLAAAAEHGAWMDVERAYSWEFPVWIAMGKVNSIQLANCHVRRNDMRTDEAGGKPRDRSVWKDPWGNAQWNQEIYYHALDCGLRVPPTAGSGSGVSPNPAGYNRVYAWIDPAEFSHDAWWKAVAAGRVVVTNGPLLRPWANNRFPGHVFRASAGETVTIDLRGDLAWRDRLSYVEVIKDGRIAHSVRIDDWAQTGHFPPLEFKDSGWFLVRAVTEVEETYRFASTGPWYVEIGDSPARISRGSVDFFRQWIEEFRQRGPNSDPRRRAEFKDVCDLAARFWEELAAKANAP